MPGRQLSRDFYRTFTSAGKSGSDCAVPVLGVGFTLLLGGKTIREKHIDDGKREAMIAKFQWELGFIG